MALSAVNSSERKKPPVKSARRIIQCGVDGVKRAQAARNAPEMRPLTMRVRRKPNQRRMVAAENFIRSAPAAGAAVSEPDWKGVGPKPACSRRGRRKGI